MREEEKLARDAYLTLYDIWGLTIFDNIVAAEEMHMDAVKLLLDRYEKQLGYDPLELITSPR